MNSKQTFFTLVMAIVMMAMCPSKLWAADTDKPWLCFTAKSSTATFISIGLRKSGTLTNVPKVQYSEDGVTWKDMTIGSDYAIGNNKVYLRAGGETGKNATFSESGDNYVYIYLGTRCNASGNIMSLLDANCEQTSVPAYAFYRLFTDCTYLYSAPELPAITLGDYCYKSMFFNCTNLTAAPELPAKTAAKACYSYMFKGCTSLTVAPELPATTLKSSCYNYMFRGCTGLTVAPELPATTLATSCYSNMFLDCTSLTVAPELPATKLANSCYNSMFKGCTKLKEVVLTGTTDYSSVTNATTDWLSSASASGVIVCPEGQSTNGITVPDGWQIKTIPADYAETQTPLCFTAIEASEIGFKISGTLTSTPSLDYSTDNATWTPYTLENKIALAAGEKVYFRAGGRFGKNATFSSGETEYIYSCSTGKFAVSGNVMSLLDAKCMRFSVPTYCFVRLFIQNNGLTTAPELPAVVLSDFCYRHMFNNCTGLTTAPVLPATTLAPSCYRYMFNGCTGLTTVPMLSATTLANYSCAYMFYDCTSLNRVVANLTEWTSNTTNYWFSGASNNGTFVCPEGLDTETITRDKSTILPGWKVARISHPSVTLNEAGFATYSADVNADLLTDGVKAYTATVDGNTITLTEIEDKCIPAGVGVVLYGENKAGTQVDFGLSLRTPTATTNALSATTNADGELVQKSTEGYTFVMNKTDNLFHPYTGTEFAANRAFLHLDTNPVASGAKGMNIVFDGDITTGIEFVNENEDENENKNCKLIENGRIVIIKNGKKFNTNGQEVK